MLLNLVLVLKNEFKKYSIEFLGFTRLFLLRCGCNSLSFFSNFHRFDLRILRIQIFSCWTSLCGLRRRYLFDILSSWFQVTAFLTLFIDEIAFGYEIFDLVLIPDFVLAWKVIIKRFLRISELIPQLMSKFNHFSNFQWWILVFKSIIALFIK